MAVADWESSFFAPELLDKTSLPPNADSVYLSRFVTE